MGKIDTEILVHCCETYKLLETIVKQTKAFLNKLKFIIESQLIVKQTKGFLNKLKLKFE